MRPPLLLALPALALAACQAPAPAPTGPVATAVTAAGNVAAANAIAPTPPVLELRGTSAFALAPAASPLTSAVETTVEPGAGFRVELPLALADARLSLLDAGDAMVPATGSREVGQATVLSLKPTSPLLPGARLRLRVDGAATRELHGADGRRFAPLEWPLLVAGDPEPRRGVERKGKRR
jgi:hypothetical protein